MTRLLAVGDERRRPASGMQGRIAWKATPWERSPASRSLTWRVRAGAFVRAVECCYPFRRVGIRAAALRSAVDVSATGAETANVDGGRVCEFCTMTGRRRRDPVSFR
jgi:hypothetical protein